MRTGLSEVRGARGSVTLRGILQLMRPVPLTVWSVPTIVFGFMSVPSPSSNWAWPLFWAILGALVLQGFVTHGLNDLYDWQSGTDQTSQGRISGGSKVLSLGLLTPRGIWSLVIAGTIVYAGVAGALASWRGWEVWIWAILGWIGAVFYSLPPMRFSYRPGLGEWGALFPAMASGVALGALAANPTWTNTSTLAVIWYGIFCVASVMQHHFSDIPADWRSIPQKRTTPAYWMHQRGRHAQEPVLFYEMLALVMAGAASIRYPLFFLPAVVASVIETVVTLRTRLSRGIDHLTRMDLAIKSLAPLTVIAIVVLKLLATSKL